MKTSKTLLAASILAAAGAANAASLNVTGSSNGLSAPFIIYPSGAINSQLTGSGTLDTVSGQLVMNYSGILQIGVLSGSNTMTIGVVETLAGSVSGNTWTATGPGSFAFNSCAGALCAALQPLPETFTESAISGSLDLTGASSVVNYAVNYTDPQVFNMITTDTLQVQAPAVPVPAAAWLFGSGLLGLAGTARRRRSA